MASGGERGGVEGREGKGSHRVNLVTLGRPQVEDDGTLGGRVSSPAVLCEAGHRVSCATLWHEAGHRVSRVK